MFTKAGDFFLKKKIQCNILLVYFKETQVQNALVLALDFGLCFVMREIFYKMLDTVKLSSQSATVPVLYLLLSR